MNIKTSLIKIHWILSTQIGIDPRILLRSISSFPKFVVDYINFRKQFKGKIRIVPCLQDRFEESGATKNEYFWQDLFVAQMIFKNNPVKHVDIGSRIDGFVAHLASFRECEVFDVRQNTAIIPGVLFKQADLMSKDSLPISLDGYCDSISCLHALEHFGLGRYGDPINSNGFQSGIENMAFLLKPDGIFYLSTPIGEERVEFNANWIFDPRKIIEISKNSGLVISSIHLIHPEGIKNLSIDADTMSNLASTRYELALFIFKKQAKGTKFS